jgi:hypothetical protein
LLGCLSLAACGDDGGPKQSEAQRALAAAPAKTKAARTALVMWRMAAGPRLLFHATGMARLDRERDRMSITVDVPTGGLPAGTKIDGFIDGYRMWVRLKRVTGWRAVPSSSRTNFNNGLAQSLSYIDGVIGEPKLLGAGSVKGAPTRRYSTQVDIRRVAQHQPAALRTSYLIRAKRLGISNPWPMIIDVDRRGRIARLRYALTAKGDRFDVDVQLYDFGVKGDVAPPPGVPD